MIRFTAFTLFFLAFTSRTQVLLFGENFTTGIPATWTIVDADGLVHDPAVSEYDPGWFHFVTATDTCAASTSFYTPAGQSADYLITPKMSLLTFSKLVWRARSYDASYPDDYIVLVSTTDSLLGSFTDTLLTVEAESPYWFNQSIHLDLEGYANQDVFIAFKNITNDGYMLLIDDVKLWGSDFASVPVSPVSPLSLYPNPCVDEVTVANFSEGDLITVYAMDGTTLLTSSQARIDVSSLKSGTYLVSLTSGESVFSAILSRH